MSAPHVYGFRFRTAALCLSFGVLLVGGCTPALDWRTLHNDAGYTIDLPAKPTLDAREIEIGGTPMRMQMQAAHVDGAVFAVGAVTLPDARAATQQAVLDALRTALSRNLQALATQRAVSVPLAAGGTAPGVELAVQGTPSSASSSASPPTAGKTLVARLVARGAHVYQAVAISDAPLTDDALDPFFGSFRLD